MKQFKFYYIGKSLSQRHIWPGLYEETNSYKPNIIIFIDSHGDAEGSVWHEFDI